MFVLLVRTSRSPCYISRSRPFYVVRSASVKSVQADQSYRHIVLIRRCDSPRVFVWHQFGVSSFVNLVARLFETFLAVIYFSLRRLFPGVGQRPWIADNAANFSRTFRSLNPPWSYSRLRGSRLDRNSQSRRAASHPRLPSGLVKALNSFCYGLAGGALMRRGNGRGRCLLGAASAWVCPERSLPAAGVSVDTHLPPRSFGHPVSRFF